MEPKVSIISPCYNGETHLTHFLDSVLNQTYKNIEFIFVNDGSIDNTEKIAKSYEDKFKEKGIDYIYVYQENQGQAAGLDNGLKIFTGDYLTWPDSDDILRNDSIERKVEFLEKNKQYGFVRTDANIVNEDDINKTVGFLSGKEDNRFNEDIFDDYIVENNAWFAPGCFMIRTEAFLEVNPKREIYKSRGGQNWQMILPMAAKYKCGYIDEPLYTYVYRDTSHSHADENLENLLKKCDIHEDILVNVVSSIENIDKDKYLKIIKEKYIQKREKILKENKI